MTPDKDVIVIGGGPAGLTAAQYSSRSNLKTALIEEMAPGGQVILISDLENYPGFPEPVNGMELSQKMEEQARNFGTEIINGTVKKLEKIDNIYHIEMDNKTITSYAVIIATGAKHRELGIPGEEEFKGRGVSYCATCDGPFFRDKKILVVGGGDAACDEATYLSKLTDKVVMIHRRDRFRAQKSLADRVMNNRKIEVRFNTVCKEIKGSMKVEKAVFEKTDDKSSYEEEFDAVFVFVGSIPQTQAVEDLPKDDGGYIITDCNMETSKKGLYAVGDVRDTPFRQIVTACGDGAIAAHSAALHIDDLMGEAYI